MKKFSIKLVLFFIPICLVFFGLEYTIRKNTYQAKAAYIEAYQDSIEVMILGSSHSWRGINPKYIRYKVAPLAHGGSAMNIDFLLFQKYFKFLPNLKVVLFEVGYHNLEDYRDKDWSKNHLFHIYYGINNYEKRPPLQDNFLLSANFKQYLTKLITSYTDTLDAEPIDEHGTVGKIPFAIFDNWEQDSLLIKQEMSVYLKDRHRENSEKQFLENTNQLNQMVQTCIANNIAVVFVSPPKPYSYNEVMIPSKLARRNNFLASYAKQKEVSIWNYERKYEYNLNLFADTDHLNVDGSTLFSKEVDSLLYDLIGTEPIH